MAIRGTLGRNALAEVVAGPDLADPETVDEDLGPSAADDIEAVPGVALAHDLCASRHAQACDAAGQGLERGHVESFQERHAVDTASTSAGARCRVQAVEELSPDDDDGRKWHPGQGECPTDT